MNLTVKIAKFDSLKSHIFLGLSAPSPLGTIHNTVLTWHKIENRNIVSTNDEETEIMINFGKFWKCGFYDWRLMEMSENGKLQTVMLTKPPVLHNFPMSGQSFANQEYSSYDEDIYDMDALIA